MSYSNPMHHTSHAERFASAYQALLEKENIHVTEPLLPTSILLPENLFKLFKDTQVSHSENLKENTNVIR